VPIRADGLCRAAAEESKGRQDESQLRPRTSVKTTHRDGGLISIRATWCLRAAQLRLGHPRETQILRSDEPFTRRRVTENLVRLVR